GASAEAPRCPKKGHRGALLLVQLSFLALFDALGLVSAINGFINFSFFVPNIY
ncbi:hypothetical protein TorRG33x02_311660, partial [Trema orientale]